jgi:hypothetical protein
MDCPYYAPRPSGAVMLRESDLHLPVRGWGRIDVSVSVSRAGRSWTDHGTARQERGSLVPELSPPSSTAAACARSSNPASREALAASAASAASSLSGGA